jgi:hypothetical protein
MKILVNSYFLIICILFLQTSLKLSAQLNLGLNFSKVNSQARPSSRIFGTPEGKYAYEFGFISETTNKAMGISLYKSFTKLFFNADITYRESKKRYMVKDYTEEINAPMNYVDESSKVIHIPVLAGCNFNNLKIGAGTFFNFNLENENKLTRLYPFVNKNRKLETGVELFLGYKLFNRVLVHARYEKAFVSIGNHIYYKQQSTRLVSTMDNITFGISIYPSGLD